MITVRNGLFETNSSSVHVLVIPKDNKITIPNAVCLRNGEYGWENDREYNTLDYFYQACVDAGELEVRKLLNYLKYKGVEEIYCREIDNDDWKNDDGYIDHSGCIPLDEFFSNESLLDRFLFGSDSFVETGNDNSDYIPDAGAYSTDEYDTIRKGN